MLDNSCQHLSCNRESSTLFVITDSAADPQSQDSCNKNEITTSNAPHSPRNDTKRTYRPNVLLSYRLKNKLSSPFTLHSSLNKKVAFTLAEVLIILGIIGVVAAMTIPTLISHHRAKVFEAQLKKSYSSISNATKMLVAQGISPYDDFSYDNAVSQRAEILMNQTRTYAKIMLGTVCEKDNINTKCGTSGSVWKNLTGANAIHRGAISAEKAFMLNDGTCILIGNYHWFIVDINGPKKGPNRVGYDIHTFKITEDNNVKPVPEGDHDTRTCTLSSKESTDIYLGYGCTPYAMMNKNPDGDGDYWHDFLGL